MNLIQLQAFCAVYLTGSFAKAAKKLNISTATMTRRIQQLEKTLQIKLFHRTTRQLVATDAGDIFYGKACTLIDNYEQCFTHLQHLKTSVSGILKIGVPTSISQLWLAPFIKQLNAKYPHLQVRIITGNHLMDLLAERFDLILHCGALQNNDFYYHHLAKWSKITCASADYLEIFGRPKKPEDLIKHQCIDHFDSLTQSWFYQKNNKMVEISIQANIQSNSSLDLKAFAIAGLGITYLPSFTIADALKNKSLIEALKPYRVAPLDIFAVFPHKRKHSKKLQVALELLESVFKNRSN